MKRDLKTKHLAGWMMGILAAALLMVGCSGFHSPTANETSEQTMEFWNPQPGDEVIPGHEVPLLREGYWENLYGPSINPFRMPPRTMVIGPDGGTLRLGHHTLIVPAGAVEERMMFRMANASQTGVAVDCDPSPFRFNRPVSLILSYQGTQYDDDNGRVPPLSIVYMAEDGTFEVMPSTVDPEMMTVTAELDHFSRYIVS